MAKKNRLKGQVTFKKVDVKPTKKQLRQTDNAKRTKEKITYKYRNKEISWREFKKINHIKTTKVIFEGLAKSNKKDIKNKVLKDFDDKFRDFEKGLKAEELTVNYRDIQGITGDFYFNNLSSKKVLKNDFLNYIHFLELEFSEKPFLWLIKFKVIGLKNIYTIGSNFVESANEILENGEYAYRDNKGNQVYFNSQVRTS